MSLSNQVTARQSRQKLCFKWPRPFWAIWGEVKIAPAVSHSLTLLCEIHCFHKTELSMHFLWLPGGLAPPCRVISNGRKIVRERHTARQRHILSRWLLFSATTQFAL